MAWKLRHEGSPQHLEGLTVHQVVEGLQDGHYETTDEVMGPRDAAWVPLENHPQFAEVCEELETPPPAHQEDETRLDMNPLIDVTMVLLIFFILVASVSAIERIVKAPALSGGGLRDVTADQVAQTMILVTVKDTQDGPRITVSAGQEKREDVKRTDLEKVFKEIPHKERPIVAIDHDDGVPHGLIVAIQDAAKDAGIESVILLTRD